ncbi:MAG TPA: VOC family protein [Candidatus Dormibacteraeota bacterium]|nr:VOC family protein [Candidatus Dormibacteraeota bacterium]
MVHIKRITPVLCVEAIEPSLQFWTERFGFTNAGEVPDGNKLGFVMLQKDGVELMYQSYASAAKDTPSMAQLARKGPTFLYIEVDDLEAILEASKGVEVVVPLRTTFYGAKEIGVRDPAGHVILFAQFTKPAEQ